MKMILTISAMIYYYPMQSQEKNGCLKWFLKHKSARTFAFQFCTCTFLTFMCLSTINLPPFQGHPNDPNIFHMIYVALVVYSIICFAGPICGAHINPAVTLAAHTSKKREEGDLKVILAYVSAQICGCTLGCIFNKLFYGTGAIIYAKFPDGLELIKDCAEQFIGTFLLVLFIFILTNEQTTFVNSQAWTHLLIGTIYYFCLTFATHFHSLNPAVIFSFQIQAMMFAPIEANTFLACLLLIAAQLLGAWVSQIVFNKIYLKQTRFWKDQFK